MIDDIQTFKEQFAKLPPVKSLASSARSIANTTDARVTDKANLSSLQGPVAYTFAKDVFEQGIEGLKDTQNGFVGITAFVNVWGDAASASTMVVSPGASVVAPSPATTWSVVISTVLDGPSLVAAKQVLEAKLLKASPVVLDINSALGPALWEAFTTLTYTVTGLDSTPSPDGPLALIAPTLSLI